MTEYVITYRINGCTHEYHMYPEIGFEDFFLSEVLNRIESLTTAGAVIIDLIRHREQPSPV